MSAFHLLPVSDPASDRPASNEADGPQRTTLEGSGTLPKPLPPPNDVSVRVALSKIEFGFCVMLHAGPETLNDKATPVATGAAKVTAIQLTLPSVPLLPMMSSWFELISSPSVLAAVQALPASARSPSISVNVKITFEKEDPFQVSDPFPEYESGDALPMCQVEVML